MKKVFIASAVVALMAACSNNQVVSESATKLTQLTHWVDSVKTLAADTAKPADSAAWAGWNTEFETVKNSIKAEELDEAGKKALETVAASWTEAGNSYSSRISAAKEAAAKAMATPDSTAAAATGAAAEAGKTVIEKAVDAGKAGLDKAGKAAEKKMHE